MWQVKAQNAESESYPTVSKEQFLAVLARMQDNANEEEPAYALKSAATFAVPPPPGLSLPPPIPTPPPMDDLACEMAVEKPAADDTDASKVEPLTIEPCKPPQQGYQVLLRDLSEMIAQEVTMRAILEQANLLEDVIRMDFRPGGKILMEFQTFASVPLCITHFHGRPWGKKSACISALYVTVKRASAASQTTAQRQALGAETKALSWNTGAPAFVPKSSTALSAAANVFVPSSLPEKTDAVRGRVRSDASTVAGPVSDAASESFDSESNESGPPDDPS
jgi:hypothetical protein